MWAACSATQPSTGGTSLGELEFTRRTSLIALCCSSASSRLRMTRASSVCECRRRNDGARSAALAVSRWIDWLSGRGFLALVGAIGERNSMVGCCTRPRFLFEKIRDRPRLLLSCLIALDWHDIGRPEPPISAAPRRRRAQAALLLSVGDPPHEGVVVFVFSSVSILPLLHACLLCHFLIIERGESKKEKSKRYKTDPGEHSFAQVVLHPSTLT